MGFFSHFEGKMEDAIEGVAGKTSKTPLSPVQISKEAERQMNREKMLGMGKQYAPTLYTVLVNPIDDDRMFGYYPTLAGEIETFLEARANQMGLSMDGAPLVRFIVDETLRRGKFDVIAECVAAPIVAQLRAEEMRRYGISYTYAQERARQAQNQPYEVNPGYQAAPVNEGGFPVEAHEADGFDVEASGFDSLDEGELDGFSGDSGYAGDDASDAQAGFDVNSIAGENKGFGTEAGARLVNLASSHEYPLRAGTFVLGRGTACDILVNDINASRRHAAICFDGQGQAEVSDLGSTNGTAVNGSRISTAPLYNGDVITVGTTRLLFSCPSDSKGTTL